MFVQIFQSNIPGSIQRGDKNVLSGLRVGIFPQECCVDQASPAPRNRVRSTSSRPSDMSGEKVEVKHVNSTTQVEVCNLLNFTLGVGRRVGGSSTPIIYCQY
jgi:hypothetical protein